MRATTPRWWYVRGRPGRPGLRAILTPLSWVWTWAGARRIARATPSKIDAPVLCVGNLTLGGSGKTPVALALALHLRRRGLGAHLLCRGHGGRRAGPLRVDPARHTAAEVGDEALMLAAHAPAWIARDRRSGARAAIARGAEAIILDDGHQDPRLAKALSLVVVDAETRDGEWPFGEGGVFPAGPLREPVAVGLARADAVVLLMPPDLPAPDPALVAKLACRPILLARLAPLDSPPAGPQLAFAGVAKPWKVERAMRAAGCQVVDFLALADHAPLSERRLVRLAERARVLGAELLTTEKDWVRLSPPWRSRIRPWRVEARFEDEAALDRLLDQAIGPPA